VFDLRYHVASLAAVFLALVLGILVGLGLSGRGFVDDVERKNLQSEKAALRAERDAARAQVDASTRRLIAADDFAVATYPILVAGRLADRKVAVLSVGPIDQTVDFAIRRAVRDAGGEIVRTRSLRVPVVRDAIQAAVAKQDSLEGMVGPELLADVGSTLGRELAEGGATPLWNALSGVLVEERQGSGTPPVDGVVVVRSVPPQQGVTHELLAGLYRGVARSGVPAVGVEKTASETSAVAAFRLAGLSTVDSVDTPTGRLGLVLLLAGGEPGQYGVEAEASSGVLPPVQPLPAKGS
jgi:hypothetical protein